MQYLEMLWLQKTLEKSLAFIENRCEILEWKPVFVRFVC